MGIGGSFCFVGHQAVGEAVSRGLSQAGLSSTDALADADVVFSYFTTQTALEDAYFDDFGLVQEARPGTLLVDLSTATPGFSRELGAVATVNDLTAVEAPLVVVDPTSPDAFSDPTNLACFVGGEDDAVAQAKELLERFVGTVHHTGGAGSAQLARAAYTLQATAQVVSAIEADALYRAFRLAGSAIAPSEAPGALTPLAELVMRAIEGQSFEGTYTVEMFMGELASALEAADDQDLILPQAEAAAHLLELLAVIGGADKAPAALSLVYDEESACAEQGLDWSRAEQAYGEEGCDDEDDDGPHGEDAGFGYGDYWAN